MANNINTDDEEFPAPKFEDMIPVDADSPEWFQRAMRPVLQRMGEFQQQLRALDARVDMAVKKRLVVPEPAMACCSPSLPPRPVASDDVLNSPAELRLLVDSQELQLRHLSMKQDKLLADVEASHASQRASLEQIAALASRIEAGDNLGFGAPIGRTLNTQDMAAMYAEMRQDLADCKKRVAVLAGLVQGGAGGDVASGVTSVGERPLGSAPGTVGA
eukprot:CAMPEP_0176261122 /NCGR_PEP_ID=MMETSP0121_2-20121125/39935_1 /TAXON_ID=160619 /ORGANISM="Kryptoperidinium foliaceum, Strain CCMP 1326" /LENGTH=216 /DNA_ID=CAMNT_0017601053 /DNA_START=95 /DNA_END=745 /DNA_ORIENTATION=-